MAAKKSKSKEPDSIDRAAASATAIVEEIKSRPHDPIVEQMHRTDEKHAREGLLQEVPIDQIEVTIESRAVNQERVKELAASIEQEGLLQPIIVYRHPKIHNQYILGPGRHRFEAHRLLGRPVIKAIVRQYVSDDQVRLAQAIENVQRHQMTPLEEADACQVIIESQLGVLTVEFDDEFELQKAVETRVAAMLGVTVKWLQGRLALNRLSPRVQQMLRDGEIFTVHAQLLARLSSHETQEEIAGRLGGTKRGKESSLPENIWRWKDAVAGELRTLVGVQWKLDQEFAGKVACNVCPSNSQNAPGLFEGGEAGTAGVPKAQCLNAACYAEKRRVAGLAVRKASNTLVKLELPKSTKGARDAIAHREVPFVNAGAVVQAAKSAMKPNQKTPAEKRGQRTGMNNEAQQKANSELHAARFEWETKFERLLAESICSDRNTMLLYLLLKEFPEFHQVDQQPWSSTSKISANREKIKDIMARFAHATDNDVSHVAGQLQILATDGRDPNSLWPTEDMPRFVRDELQKRFGVDVGPEPKLEDFLPIKAQTDAERAKKPAKKKTSRKAVLA